MANKVVTFDGAPPPGAINFGVGQPSADFSDGNAYVLDREDYH
jgi:hypothetical protein